MTPRSLWKTILFCLHLHRSSFFLLFCSQKTHGTFANIFKSCEKQDFFFSSVFLSLPPRRCFFLRRARQCQARLGSSWMPRASESGGLVGLRGWKREKKNKVGEILLISSCRFHFLYLTMAPLFGLTRSVFAYFLSFDRGLRKLWSTAQERTISFKKKIP